MGLDNGILARSATLIPALKPYYEHWKSWNKSSNEVVYELCYWRKCWNVRSLILKSIKSWSGDDEYEYPLTPEYIDNIIAALSGLNKKNWNDDGGSIWEWSEMRDRIKYQIKALKKLRKAMKKHEIEVWFYDSY